MIPFQAIFNAEHAENAEVNPERKSFLCVLCALRVERYVGIFRVPKQFNRPPLLFTSCLLLFYFKRGLVCFRPCAPLNMYDLNPVREYIITADTFIIPVILSLE